MKHIIVIEDENPDDMARYRNMLRIEDWIAVLQDVDNELRRILKHENKPAEVQQELMLLRQALHESLNDRQLDLYS